MIRLRQTFGVHTGRCFDLSGDQPVCVGRAAEADIAFDPEGDLDASGQHAELRREGSTWVVVDVGSRNGTFLNGDRVERAVLKGGDELEFGEGGPRMLVESIGLTEEEERERARAALGDAATVVAPGGASAGFASAHEGVAGADTGRQYGPDTVQRMIREAVENAQADAVQHEANVPTTRRPPNARRGRGLLVAAGCLALLGALAILGTAAVVLVSRVGSAPEQRDDGTEPEIASPSHFAASAGTVSAFVIRSAAEPNGPGCAAVAVRPTLLASAASCVLPLHQAPEARGALQVLGSAGATAGVTRLWRHPAYRDKSERSSPDLAIVEVERAIGQPVEVPQLSAVRQLKVGDALAVLVPTAESDSLGFAFKLVAVRQVLSLTDSVNEGALLRLREREAGGHPEASLEEGAVVHTGAIPPGSALLNEAGELMALSIGNDHALRVDVILSLLAGLDA